MEQVKVSAETGHRFFCCLGGNEFRTLLSTIAAVLVLLVMPISCGFPAAVSTEILFDGEEIEELRGFCYKVYDHNHEDAVSADLQVKGKVLVHSNSELLNGRMETGTSFRIALSTTNTLSSDQSDNQSFILEACRLDTIHSLVNNITDKVDFRVYSFTCGEVSGELPTSYGIVTSESLDEWELDSSGLSIRTLIIVADGAEATDTIVDEVSFEDATAYQLSGHGYSMTTYDYILERAREV